VIVILALALGHVLGSFRAPDLPEAAPDFALTDLDGNLVRLSELRGQRVVLNFWATWCLPCRLEVPALTRWAARNPDALVLGIAADGTVDELRASGVELGITYPILRGHRQVMKDYGVDTFPTTVVIGPKGDVITAFTGLLTDPQLAWIARER